MEMYSIQNHAPTIGRVFNQKHCSQKYTHMAAHRPPLNGGRVYKSKRCSQKCAHTRHAPTEQGRGFKLNPCSKKRTHAARTPAESWKGIQFALLQKVRARRTPTESPRPLNHGRAFNPKPCSQKHAAPPLNCGRAFNSKPCCNNCTRALQQLAPKSARAAPRHHRIGKGMQLHITNTA